MKTFHIHIKGIVQGVGFRPFVYKLAQNKKVNGTVSNTTDGVHILINSTQKALAEFVEELKNKPPLRSSISQITVSEAPPRNFEDFRIIKSETTDSRSVLLTPDFGVCSKCNAEIIAKGNRRYDYAFTTCTICGPRYSIIDKVPYDRHNTSMDRFQMCGLCLKEYLDVSDRRYYSQTNSCPECTINMKIEEGKGIFLNEMTAGGILNRIVEHWGKGKIVAIKGIGGYLLTCDATNIDTINRLRELKQRPSKPLAVMYQGLSYMTEDVVIDSHALDYLLKPEAPIVLVKKKKDPLSKIKFDAIAPNLDKIGVMLSYTPQFTLLLNRFQKPIIATSGNLSGDPIEHLNPEASETLFDIADIILHNDRNIVVPQDDSVWNITPVKKQRIILRRSRGMAPSILLGHLPAPQKCLLSMGGILKSTFGLTAHQNIYISQYLGDTDTYRTQRNYQQVLTHLLNTFKVKPETIICDKHPGYFSSMEGERMAKELCVPLYKVQHHKAHLMAILAEHDLIESDARTLGIIWDGTGLGEDGNIWGGEALIYENRSIERLTHIPYFDHRLGDKMAKEPRISALSLLDSYKINYESIAQKFKGKEWVIYKNMLKSPSPIKCSSMGRLFDAAASIVLNIDTQTYEGEAAMMLENAANKFFIRNRHTRELTYLNNDIELEFVIPSIIASIVDDVKSGVEAPFIAARFHVSLVDYIDRIANHSETKRIVFSGGSFQNACLVDLANIMLNRKYDLYFHNLLSPNDENIAFGQLMHYLYKF